MDIRKEAKTIPFIFLCFCISCQKKKEECPKFGYEYTYNRPGVQYAPGDDSILLGNDIVLYAAVAKTFYDSTHNTVVTLDASFIKGSIVINKATGNPAIPIGGAMNDMQLFSLLGTVYKDSVAFTPFQLERTRSLEWANSTDSFRLSIKIRPLMKGTYFIGLNQQSNRDNQCALYKYFAQVRNPDQHHYYISQINGGQVSEFDLKFTYCFKVY